MFLILLFFHLLAVAMLFAAMGIELAVYVALHRAQTVAQAPPKKRFPEVASARSHGTQCPRFR